MDSCQDECGDHLQVYAHITSAWEAPVSTSTDTTKASGRDDGHLFSTSAALHSQLGRARMQYTGGDNDSGNADQFRQRVGLWRGTRRVVSGWFVADSESSAHRELAEL